MANSRKPDEEELSYRGFSNFDEIALTDPNDQQKQLEGISIQVKNITHCN